MSKHSTQGSGLFGAATAESWYQIHSIMGGLSTRTVLLWQREFFFWQCHPGCTVPGYVALKLLGPLRKSSSCLIFLNNSLLFSLTRCWNESLAALAWYLRLRHHCDRYQDANMIGKTSLSTSKYSSSSLGQF